MREGVEARPFGRKFGTNAGSGLLDPAVAAPKSMERHHLFPKAYLVSLGIAGTRQVNAIANMAFLDWSENAKISNASPAEYWPAMTADHNP